MLEKGSYELPFSIITITFFYFQYFSKLQRQL